MGLVAGVLSDQPKLEESPCCCTYEERTVQIRKAGWRSIFRKPAEQLESCLFKYIEADY